MTVENNARTTGKRLGGITGKGFMPGQSGNPGGRPKKTKLTDAHRALLEQPFPNDPQGRTWAERIALAQGKAAAKGKTRAATELREATEGKATMRIDLNVQSEEELDDTIAALLEKANYPSRASNRRRKAKT